MAAKAATLTTRARKTRPRWVKRVKQVFALGFLLFLIGFTVFGIVFVNEMKHASELMTTLPEKLRQYSAEPTRILSKDGVVLWSIQSEFREPIKYEQLPENVRDALVAAEDKRFFDHSGVDYWAMGRILVVGAKEGKLSQGGSTLTMQLAKRFYSEGERTFKRKMQDVALAITMERDMTKEQILTLYLNTMYFGEKAYGIEAASEVYFGKSVGDLTLAEAAMLARCVRRPSHENPVRAPEKSIENRNIVLKIMLEEGKITKQEYDEAIAEPVKLAPRKERITSRLNKAPYFVDHVLKFLEEALPDVDLKSGGYTIHTTLDSKLQSYAEQRVRDFVKEYRRSGKVNSAMFMLMDKDGRILAEVGGLDYSKSQYNIVTQSLLQPGSAFKPFLYASAFSTGALDYHDSLENSRFVYDMGPGADPWSPENSNGRYSRSTSVYNAFVNSYNVPAAHVMERIGPQAVKSMATSIFGFKSLTRTNLAPPAMALGSLEVRPIEMAEGYSVFMLHGDRATPYCVTKIVGPDGNIVRTYGPNIIRNQLDQGVAAQMDELLHGVVTSGTASRNVGGYLPEARGKTGTTSNNKDAWFCGYVDGLVGVAWIGNMTVRNNQVYQLPMHSRMFGGSHAAQFWRDIMKQAIKRKLGSKVSAPLQPVEEPEPDEGLRNSEDRVRVIRPEDRLPEEELPADGTTGGDGGPVVVPNPATTTTGGAAEPPTTTDPPVAEPPPVRRDPPREEPSEVAVEICAESGSRATIYCPETVTRNFRKGRAPRGRCSVHGG